MRRVITYIFAAVVIVSCCKPTGKKDIFVPEKTKMDTMYHIEAIDGDLIYYDSIRIETRHFPERYIRWISSDQCIVFVGSDTMNYDEYRHRYCEPVATYTHAERDTIRNIHSPGFYKKTGVWALQQILVTGYRP